MGKIIMPGERAVTPTDFSKAEHIRKEAGGCMLDGMQVGSTLRCCHCGLHWIVIRGSGRQRGFCMKCMDVTCGAPECIPCLPYEKRIDMIEKGLIQP
jgi:hypothetical protein